MPGGRFDAGFRQGASIIGRDDPATRASRFRTKEAAMNRDRLRIPRPAAPAIAPAAFVLYPVVCVPAVSAAQALWIEALYRQALEQAQEVARPSLPERDLLGVWN